MAIFNRLEYEATLAETPRAIEVATLIASGILRQVSIGFDAGKSYFKTINGEKTRFITEIKRLYEISLVNYAADSKASVYPVKTSQSIDDEILAMMHAHELDEEIYWMAQRVKYQ